MGISDKIDEMMISEIKEMIYKLQIVAFRQFVGLHRLNCL